MKEAQKQAYESIVRQWNGGERRLAGARASELVYGAGRKADEKLLDQLREEIPGIEQFISAPDGGAVVEQAPDEGGNPLTNQPQSKPSATGKPNLSSDKAKKEQRAVDKVLEPGRKARARAAGKTEGKQGAGEIVSTKLDPDPDNPTKP
ncbi:hypothetical protein FY145_01090 [Agrobacterium tumefaciens]|uniref:hypothetical protein n=1 Tax=Agrobacterium tumefaciens TaxID=358 RepID=UPI0021D33A64|nr:hypothetical protein [Agrobacterium tumefaciens]UXS69170.1 hypothetical protein FY146_01090 [Agrobacterium tumefaciens]UXS76833.1 hypothetical protein FY145_01090 [Agrobacterium tumefaciens]